MIKIEARCEKHPQYKGIYPPRVECRACKMIFQKRQILTLEGRVNCNEHILEDDSVLIECVK